MRDMAQKRPKKDYHPTFGNTLRTLREQYGVSAIQLGEYVGLSKYPYQIISSWETGKREPTLLQLCKIAEFFGTSTDVLLGLKPIQPLSEITAYLIRHQITEEQEKKILKIIATILDD